jgi:monofunctional biosynthetic peptidoglycan transglycosylase
LARWTYGKRFAGPKTLAARVGRWLVAGAAFFYVYVTALYLTLPDVRVLADDPPATTAFIELRAREAKAEARPFERVQHWVSYDAISPALKRAVLVAEDSAFFEHQGIDYEELRKSMELNWEHGDFSRGASTITQQLAKNLYLSPSRNPFRKFRELLITRLLEGALSKQRILELYLNCVEWGDGIFGAEAAARTYFRVPASGLNAEQSALLAGSLINPRRYSPGAPPRRLLARQRIILRRMRIGGGPLTATAQPRVSESPRATAQESEVPAELESLEEDAEAPTEEAAPPPGSTVPPAAQPAPAQDPP